MKTSDRILELLADILEYPSFGLREKIHECGILVSGGNCGAYELINEFEKFWLSNSLESVEEIYTRTFDLQPACYPYIGYHLFGEDYKRGTFMAKLNELYSSHNFIFDRRELPDHISVILRFLTKYSDPQNSEEFASLCLIPSIEKMQQGIDDSNPYNNIFKTLLIVIKEGDGNGNA